MVIAHIMMTGQLTAASECLISLNTMAAFWSPSPLGRTIRMAEHRQYRPPTVRVLLTKTETGFLVNVPAKMDSSMMIT